MDPHASDCAFWVDEPCDCMYRFDACDLYKEHRDALIYQANGMLDVLAKVAR